MSAESFRDRLLDLLPIYSATGRRLARLEPPDADDRTAALALADAAVRRWTRDALALAGERENLYDAVAGSLRDLDPVTDDGTARAAAEIAVDVARLARPMPGHADLEDVARAAARATEAAAEGRWVDTGTAAADCLYGRIGSGTDYVATEAAEALGLPPGG